MPLINNWNFAKELRGLQLVAAVAGRTRVLMPGHLARQGSHILVPVLIRRLRDALVVAGRSWGHKLRILVKVTELGLKPMQVARYIAVIVRQAMRAIGD